MRRVICLCVLAAVLFPVLALGAPPLTEDDFVFTYEAQAYRLGEPALPLLTAIEAGEGPLSVTEADSCMFSGLDKEFESGTILLATYPIGPGGADVLETILVVGGAHETARGISIGAPMEAVTLAYGEEYIFDYDQMVYALGDPLTEPILVFLLDLGTGCVASFFMMRNTLA